jgi:hypothetical protein
MPDLNNFSEERHLNSVKVSSNAMVDEGENGVIRFPNGLPITDNTVQKNGTRYDIDSMALNEYDGQVTVDHDGTVASIVGKALGVIKSGTQVVIEGIQFATRESALARLTHDLMVGGYVKQVSIETYGPPPDEQGVYQNARLVGLSIVPIGNNNNARINKLVMNSIQKSKEEGLDTAEVEDFLAPEPQPEFNAATGTHHFTFTGTSGDVTITLPPETLPNITTTTTTTSGTAPLENNAEEPNEQKDKVMSDTDATVTEPEVTTVPEPNTEPAPQPAPEPAPALQEETKKVADEDAENRLKSIIESAVKPLTDKINALEQNQFDKTAKEPEFKKTEGVTVINNKYGEMDWRLRTAEQLKAVQGAMLGHNYESGRILHDINSYNLDALKAAGKADNAVSLTDLGNFVIPPEMITEIQGFRSNYQPLLSRFAFSETLSLDMTWLSRNGEISMDDVDYDSDAQGANDLKPLKEYNTVTHTARLKEFAAVTPVDAAAVRFAAVDVVGDITSSYRLAYDQALARSVIGRLELAVQGNGNAVNYDFSTAGGGNVGGLLDILTAWTDVAEATPDGLFIMNVTSYAEILGRALRAGVTGPISQLFTTGDQPLLFGRPYVVVPNNLLPSLNTAQTKSWTFEGQAVTVRSALIYTDPSNFKGRVSGGLNFTVSTEAAYEESGTVKSAFQRDKMLFRGYGYRKSAITDTTQVAGLVAAGIS